MTCGWHNILWKHCKTGRPCTFCSAWKHSRTSSYRCLMYIMKWINLNPTLLRLKRLPFIWKTSRHPRNVRLSVCYFGWYTDLAEKLPKYKRVLQGTIFFQSYRLKIKHKGFFLFSFVLKAKLLPFKAKKNFLGHKLGRGLICDFSDFYLRNILLVKMGVHDLFCPNLVQACSWPSGWACRVVTQHIWVYHSL